MRFAPAIFLFAGILLVTAMAWRASQPKIKWILGVTYYNGQQDTLQFHAQSMYRPRLTRGGCIIDVACGVRKFEVINKSQ